MISRLSFAAPFVYSPRGESEVSRNSRRLRDRIKRGDTEIFAQIADHVAQLVASGTFEEFFGGDVTLVPTPGHAPLAPGAVSITRRITDSLLSRRLAASAQSLLDRQTAVSKSAFSPAHLRPKASDHFDSLVCNGTLLSPKRVLLVDDFVTRGATLLGAASRIAEAFPGIEIRAFALVRSVTDGDVLSIRDPRVGVIELDLYGDAWRRP